MVEFCSRSALIAFGFLPEVAVASLLVAGISYCQEEYPPAIEDNSFYIEEAYNQDLRVVQHIFTTEVFPSKDEGVNMTFTQEWRVGGLNHQLSYTFVYPTAESGPAFLFANYRYQLFNKYYWACVSPRLSLFLPLRSPGASIDRIGAQVNIPASKRLGEFFVAHFNLGATFDRTFCGTENEDATTTTWDIGGSLIWLQSGNFNLMLEALELVTPSEPRLNRFLLSPGARFAINLDRTQIVPGIGFPAEFTRQGTTTGFFLYLSVEHPY